MRLAGTTGIAKWGYLVAMGVVSNTGKMTTTLANIGDSTPLRQLLSPDPPSTLQKERGGLVNIVQHLIG